MLLAVDVGNTHIVLGLFDEESLCAHWRIETRSSRPADEYLVLLRMLLTGSGKKPDCISSMIVSSVVPTLQETLGIVGKRLLGRAPLFVGPGIRTGMPILYENPREVGADRIVNSVAAYEKMQCGLIVVDFGTATTFDVVSPRGEYLGGAICPGMEISMTALFHHAAKLPRVDLRRPDKVVGRNTISSMQSGLIFGYVGLVEGMIKRIRKEIDFKAAVAATGGLASIVAGETELIERVEPDLTLEGLRLIHERNRFDAFQDGA